MRTFAFTEHDHRHCVREALRAAERICRVRGLRLTPLRKRVFELVWDSHGPLGAYDVLDRLRTGPRRAAPPTVYRALQFLTEAGLVHRIESRNAYVGCIWPENDHAAQYLICGDCGEVAEIEVDAARRALGRRAKALAFTIERQVIEVVGRCSRCGDGRDDGARHG